MYSKKEELIDYNFERNLLTGEFTFDILTQSVRATREHKIKSDVVYRAEPLHFTWYYLFRLYKDRLYIFKRDKDHEIDKDMSLIIVQESKKIIDHLRKMLDRAEISSSEDIPELAHVWKSFAIEFSEGIL